MPVIAKNIMKKITYFEKVLEVVIVILLGYMKIKGQNEVCVQSENKILDC